MAQRKRPAIHGRPPAGLIRPKPSPAPVAPCGPNPAGPTNGEVPDRKAAVASNARHPAVRIRRNPECTAHAHLVPALSPLDLRLPRSRGRSPSSATCGTERCGRNRPAGGRLTPAVFAKAASRLENPRPQRARAGAQPSNTAAQRPPYPSAGATGATRVTTPGSAALRLLDPARAPSAFAHAHVSRGLFGVASGGAGSVEKLLDFLADVPGAFAGDGGD